MESPTPPLIDQANGLPEQNVELEVFNRGGTEVDTVVAASALDPGATLLRIPERLVVTLDRIFQDATLAELLTTNKLSELACLALYLAYEKKRGAASFWHPFIRELDRLRGRGPQGARSPLLWEEEEVQEFLAGSPVLDQIQARIRVGGAGLRMLLTGLRWCRGGDKKGLSGDGNFAMREVHSPLTQTFQESRSSTRGADPTSMPSLVPFSFAGHRARIRRAGHGVVHVWESLQPVPL